VKVPVRPQLEELSQAREILKKAEEAIKQGNWEDFGKAMDELQSVLRQQPKKQ
jgi:ribosomal protein S20